MKACVTGASGYLGTHLVEQLLMEGWCVTAFDLQKSIRLPEDVHFISGDIRDAQKVKEAAKGCDVIFHLVGIMPQAKANAKLMQDINVGGTENVLKSAVQNKIKRVVFLSSSEVYGRHHRSPVKEDGEKHPLGEYGRNKLQAEGLCLKYAEKHGLEVVILRPSTIVGENMTDFLMRGLLHAALNFPVLFTIGNGKAKFQMSGLNDVLQACVLAAAKDGVSGEAFNIGAEDVPSMKEQMRALSEKLGVKKLYVPLPAGLTKKILRALHRMNVSPLVPDHFELMDEDVVMDCEKAKKLLGWTPGTGNVDMLWQALQSYRTETQLRKTGKPCATVNAAHENNYGEKIKRRAL